MVWLGKAVAAGSGNERGRRRRNRRRDDLVRVQEVDTPVNCTVITHMSGRSRRLDGLGVRTGVHIGHRSVLSIPAGQGSVSTRRKERGVMGAFTSSSPSANRPSIWRRVSLSNRSAAASSRKSKEGVSMRVSPNARCCPLPSGSKLMSMDAVRM